MKLIKIIQHQKVNLLFLCVYVCMYCCLCFWCFKNNVDLYLKGHFNFELHIPGMLNKLVSVRFCGLVFVKISSSKLQH